MQWVQCMSKKYDLPPFLSGIVSLQSYLRWLSRKSSGYVRRDKKRGNISANNEAYKVAIHRAVLESDGRDAYTGELLNWSLISRYSNAESKAMRRQYKASFALLPTVDYVGDGLGRADFKICSWRTNDAKHDLTHEEFVELCRLVVMHFDGKSKGSKLATRTTLTIDNDLAGLLKRRARARAAIQGGGQPDSPRRSERTGEARSEPGTKDHFAFVRFQARN